MTSLDRLTLVLLLAAGCDRWSYPEPLWSIEIHNAAGTTAFAPSLMASVAPDGETRVAFADLSFDGQPLVGSHVARLDRDGQLRALAAVPGVPVGGVVTMGVDARGRMAAVWGSGATAVLTAFDEQLALRWQRLLPGSVHGSTYARGAFAVGPGGEVAVVAFEPTGATTLVYVGEDGVERWTRSSRSERLAIAENGDVHAGEETRRLRLRAADGAIIDEQPLLGIRALSSTGIAVGVQAGIDGDELTVYEASGALRWRQSIVGIGYCPFGGCVPESPRGGATIVIGPTEDILAQLHQTDEQRLSRASGDLEGVDVHCGSPAIVDVDEIGYVAYGPSCPSGLTLAKYPLPD